MKVAVVKESAPGEHRVALVPEMIARLRGAGLEVLVESGAGDGAWFADSAYADAGATVVSREELLAGADLVVTVARPDPQLLDRLRSGQAIVGLLNPLADPGLAKALADRGVTAISLDGLPRTLSRAQGMDALSSQAGAGVGGVVRGGRGGPHARRGGESPGRPLHRAAPRGRRGGGGGLPRARGRGEPPPPPAGAAGPHPPPRRGHHHRPGARPQAAA